jgi:membrane protein DedA with SNARE-associated domain
LLHSLVSLWFHWVQDWGYIGIFILMALESTIVPVPSEVVMPPAAYWAAQGQLNFWGVVAAGTLGSYFGSAISYFVLYKFGGKILTRFGKYVGLSEDKIAVANDIVAKHGAFGIFVSRFLPVVRHLVSMPAGAFKMRFSTFSIATLIGSGLWCYILSLWGQKVLGAHPELLNSPEEMILAVKAELIWFVFGVLAIAALYALVIFYKKKSVR